LKLLDEKGRLFGKINLVDLVTVLVLVAALAAVGWKLGGRKVADAVADRAPTYEYEVICSKVYPDICEYAETCVGDQLLAGSKLLNGEIAAVVTKPHTEMSDSTGARLEDADYRDLYVTIRCKPSKVGGSLTIGTQELRVGKSHIVKSTKLEISNGLILSMEQVADE